MHEYLIWIKTLYEFYEFFLFSDFLGENVPTLRENYVTKIVSKRTAPWFKKDCPCRLIKNYIHRVGFTMKRKILFTFYRKF